MNPAAVFYSLVIVLVFIVAAASGQGVKRVVIVKVDGVPEYFVDKYVKQRDPETGKSQLPWIDDVFYKNGTHLQNFYTRGMSLTGPSWSTIDTGQHLQIKGNVEFDRYTLHSYDYLNFFPYYLNYGLKKAADMPAVEVLDQLKVPLMVDAFPFEKRYVSHQLNQRGNNWSVIAGGLVKLYPGDVGDLIDEWTLGLNFSGMTFDQTVRDVVKNVVERPEVDYLDYYDVSFDHIGHGNNDPKAQLAVMKKIDATIGRFWMAINSSSRADETALIMVSDHGFNSEEKVYSQGFNIVRLLNKASAGGHHVVTKRRLMQDYSIKGLYPFIPLIRTASKESLYLKGQNDEYPTVMVDFDGNERSSIHFRNSDLNVLHILLQQLQRKDLPGAVRNAATDAFFEIIDEHRGDWQKTVVELKEELGALDRQIESQEKAIAAFSKKFSPEEQAAGKDHEARRMLALNERSKVEVKEYREYLPTLERLLKLKKEDFEPRRLKIEDLIAPGAMGDRNSVYQLQNYVVGPAPGGLKLGADGRLDLERSFIRVDYFSLFPSQTVINNVQPKLSTQPIDFVSMRLPLESIAAALPADLKPDEDPYWIFASAEKQALILPRTDEHGGLSFRYLPVAGLRQNADGTFSFQTREWSDGFPLKIFEDPGFAVPPSAQRGSWLNEWHTELEWLNAVHKTKYSNAIVGLHEQLDRHSLHALNEAAETADEKLIGRFRQRQRQLAEADILIHANSLWNFDVKGFNAGGNHGGFYRVSTNAVFMLAGGAATGIPRGLRIDAPYDTLSFVPTVFALMGKIDADNRPDESLQQKGFYRFPGRVVREALPSGSR